MALWMTAEQRWFGLAALLLVFSCVFFQFGMEKKTGRDKGRRLALFMLCGSILFGIIRMSAEQQIIKREEKWLEIGKDETVQILGLISDIQDTDYGIRIELARCTIQCESGDNGKIRRIYCYLSEENGEEVQLKFGMKVRIEGTCRLPDPDRNPGSFSYRSYCLAKGITGMMDGEEFSVLDEDYWHFSEKIRKLKHCFSERFDQIADHTDAGILKAVLLGDKSDLDDSVYELYQKNGISHVLAISGLHVSVIGMGVWKGFRRLGMDYYKAGFLASVLLILYGKMAGFSPSVIRAVLMMMVSFLAECWGRTYDLPSAMCVPAIVLLYLHPYLLTQASFQLSFLAVTAIFFPGGYLVKHWNLKGIKEKIWISMSIQLMTLPAVMFHSFEIPTYGVILNLIVIPLMTYVLISGILGLSISFIHMRLGTIFLGAAHYILYLYELLCKHVVNLQGANLIVGRPEWTGIVLYYFLLCMGVCLAVKKSRKWFFLLYAVGFVFIKIPDSGFTVTFLDVGQGDGIFLQSGEKNILVDCGSSQKTNLGEDVLIPFLKSQGISVLNTVVVTHGDQDHMSGIMYLLEHEESGIEIQSLVMADIISREEEDPQDRIKSAAEKRRIPVRLISAGETLSDCLDGVSVICLSPMRKEAVKDRNEGSVVLMVRYGNFRMILTGDLGKEGEKKIAERGLLSQVTVLKAGHHGSVSSTGEEFLEEIQPDYVIVSYGEGNRYGHPSKEVLERCGEIGAVIYKTAESGAVRIWTDGESLRILEWLDR